MLDVGKVVILKNGCEYTEEQPQCSSKSCYCSLGRKLIFIGPSKIIIVKTLMHNITRTLITAFHSLKLRKELNSSYSS